MNEKLQYADMLEIPVNTTNISYKPIKKKRTKKKSVSQVEDVKKQLLDKVNNIEEQNLEMQVNEQQESAKIQENDQVTLENSENETNANKKHKKFSIISLQLVVIGLLLAVILITNAVYSNSGINTFLKNVFSPDSTLSEVDERVYLEFTPTFVLDEETLANIAENGSMTISGESSAYSPCDGKVVAINGLENGEYSMEIAHSENFSTIITGLKYCYANIGDKVLKRVPVGYVEDKEFSLCFLNSEGAVVTGYQLVENQVVWGV